MLFNESALADLRKKIETYKNKGFNMLPATEFKFTPAIFQPVIRIVNITTDDIYEGKDSRLELSAKGVQKFISAGRIRLDDPKISYADSQDDLVVNASIEGWRFNADLSVMSKSAAESVTVATHSKELEEHFTGLFDKKIKDDLGTCDEAIIGREKIKFIRSNFEFYIEDIKRTLSKSLALLVTRSITSQLLGLKESFTKEEIRSPFVIISVEDVENFINYPQP